MEADTRVTFGEMARAYPVRTALFTFGPPAFAGLQLANGYVNDASLPLVGVLVAVMVAFAVLTTQFHLASFRLSRLQGASGENTN